MVENETQRPAERVRAACRKWGEPAVARRCAALLGDPSTVDLELLHALGPVPAWAFLPSGEPSYWVPTWAARALLYAWDPAAEPAVVAGLANPAWRVREMSAKVCVVRELGSAADALAALASDPVPRVRAAAARALGVVGEAEHGPILRSVRSDEDSAVAGHADRALRRLSVRLDRVLD